MYTQKLDFIFIKFQIKFWSLHFVDKFKLLLFICIILCIFMHRPSLENIQMDAICEGGRDFRVLYYKC